MCASRPFQHFKTLTAKESYAQINDQADEHFQVLAEIEAKHITHCNNQVKVPKLPADLNEEEEWVACCPYDFHLHLDNSNQCTQLH